MWINDIIIEVSSLKARITFCRRGRVQVLWQKRKKKKKEKVSVGTTMRPGSGLMARRRRRRRRRRVRGGGVVMGSIDGPQEARGCVVY